MKLALLLIFMLLPLKICISHAQNNSIDIQPVPDSVLNSMISDGHSLRFQKIDIGPGQGQLFGHIYKAQKNYIIDIFRPWANGNFHRINSLNLGDTPHSNSLSLSFMWLQPKHWKGPILILQDNDCPSEWDVSYDVVVLPEGFKGRFTKQTFFYKGIGGTIIFPSFDNYDESGLLVITQHDAHEGTGSQTAYFWNGNGFAERSPRYAVIGPLFKTRAQAQAFRQKYFDAFPDIGAFYSDYPDGAERDLPILPSRYFKSRGIKPGYLLNIIAYCGLRNQAKQIIRYMPESAAYSVIQLY